MNVSLATELKDLIDKWHDHPGVTDDEICDALLDAFELIAPAADPEKADDAG